VDSGFFCATTFERDEWLDPLRDHPDFVSALARARLRVAGAASKFHDAGCDRLLLL
jgi:hypothetical protein